MLQCNNLPSSGTPRGHQFPAAFMIRAAGMDKVTTSKGSVWLFVPQGYIYSTTRLLLVTDLTLMPPPMLIVSLNPATVRIFISSSETRIIACIQPFESSAINLLLEPISLSNLGSHCSCCKCLVIGIVSPIVLIFGMNPFVGECSKEL